MKTKIEITMIDTTGNTFRKEFGIDDVKMVDTNQKIIDEPFDKLYMVKSNTGLIYPSYYYLNNEKQLIDSMLPIESLA